jgi:hypothetical protein
MMRFRKTYSRSIKSRLGVVIPVALAIVFVPLMATLMPRCGAYEPALAAINECPAAVQALGEGIEQRLLGVSCGSSKTSGSQGYASWSLPVAGSSGAGTYSYEAQMSGGVWTVTRGQLEVGGRTVGVVPCGAQPSSAPTTTTALRAAVELVGRVDSVEGYERISQGDACTVVISPTPPEATARGFNCHVKVKCGTVVLYGWQGVGITHCETRDGHAISASDTQGAAEREGDPLLEIDLERGWCEVSDNGDRPYEVSIAFER